MQQRKSKKILIYFFLLLLVGSINNINFNNLKFEKIENIKVTGLDKYENLNLLTLIQNSNLNNIFFINRNNISKIVNSSNLVEEYEIFKIYPSSIAINIKKTKFLAKINSDGKIFILGSNGKFLNNDNKYNQLPFIFGKPKIDEFLNFKKIIDQSKFSFNEIKNLYYFSSNRWDLELKNNLIIKLSKENPEESLKFAFEFLHNKDLKDIKIIDARIKNQIILNG